MLEGLDLGSVTPILLLGNGCCSNQRKSHPRVHRQQGHVKISERISGAIERKYLQGVCEAPKTCDGISTASLRIGRGFVMAVIYHVARLQKKVVTRQTGVACYCETLVQSRSLSGKRDSPGGRGTTSGRGARPRRNTRTPGRRAQRSGDEVAVENQNR